MLRFGFLLLIFMNILFFQQGRANAEEIHVNPGESIQKAIQKANNNATIMVHKGQYNGNIVIDKSIVLKGEEGTIIAGEGDGDVIQVVAPHVTIENFIIEKSGKIGNHAGIRLDSSDNLIQNNTIKEIHFGLYINKGSRNKIINNHIIGYDGHFSTKGNGVHLFYAENTALIGNRIENVQDGVYFDFAKNTTLKNNRVEHSRYGYHVMYAKEGIVTNNISTHNITGCMIMDTEDFSFTHNIISNNLDFRGHGILVFDSDRIEIAKNKVTFNNTGLSLQDARQCTIEGNIFAGNYIGLDLKDKNENNKMFHNNFVGNIVQTKIFTEVEPMDVNGRGNYWDDYRGMDLNGDGIGEIPYESGKLFDQLMEENPMLQFFFESPTIKLWSSIETIFPAFSGDRGMDRYPLMEPIQYDNSNNYLGDEKTEANIVAGLLGFVMLSLSLFIFYLGRVM